MTQKQANNQIKTKKSKSNGMQSLLPLPWSIWPAEARLLITLIAFWSIAGILILASASWWVASKEMGDGSYYVKRQILWLISSWSLLFFTISTNIRSWSKVAGTIFLIGYLLILSTLLFGITLNGASRWLIIGPLQIQPSELIKPFVILQGANIFSNWRLIKIDQKIFWIGIFTSLLLLILKQPNLSTAALTGILIWLIALAA